MEDKPYCDVAMDEVIPAVKTLIRAVRSVPTSRGQEVKSRGSKLRRNLMVFFYLRLYVFYTFMAGFFQKLSVLLGGVNAYVLRRLALCDVTKV